MTPDTERMRRLSGVRILVAEDNNVNQIVLKAMLAPEGPEVVCVDNGEQAVARVTEQAEYFDIVLMDLQMPVMDGFDAAERIHAIAPNLPVIAQTAHVLTETIERCRDIGMVAHVGKPIDREALIAIIQQHARTR
jgi:hypothetical protein